MTFFIELGVFFRVRVPAEDHRDLVHHTAALGKKGRCHVQRAVKYDVLHRVCHGDACFQLLAVVHTGVDDVFLMEILVEAVFQAALFGLFLAVIQPALAKFVVVFQNHLVTVELIHCVGHNDRGVAPGAGAVVETVHKAEHTAYQPAPTREQMTKIESIMRFEFARRDMIPHARSEH